VRLWRKKIMSKKASVFCVLMFFLWIGPAPCLFAQKQAAGTLEGLKNIHIRIRLIMDSGSKGSGLTQGLLELDAEELLRDAGLKVVSQDEFQRLLPSRGYPVATLDIDSRISKPGDAAFYVFYLNIKVGQPVFMSRKPVIKFVAPTWEISDFGTVDTPAALRETAKEGVRAFIQDFKGENP
jgi:hypothetical protein